MRRFTGFVRGHLGAAIAAAAAVIVLVGGVLVLVSAGSGGTPVATTGTTNTTVAGHKAKRPKGGGGKNRTVRGQITAIDGGTWTVVTNKGVTMTIEVSPSTAFGTKNKPLAASNFAVGDPVVVTGAHNGTSVSASRVAKGGKGPAASTTTSTP